MKRILSLSVLLVWMGVIFAFSEQPGSGSNWEPPLWYVLERKSAHVVEYAILMACTFFFFRSIFLTERFNRLLGLAFTFAVTYGVLDEIHQAFVFGRGSRFSDVLIDAGGAIVMGLFFFLWNRYLVRRNLV